MMRISGELAFVINDINYTSKKDLLDKLRELRQSLGGYSPSERKIIKPYLAVAIQQAFYSSEYELMRYRRFLDNRGANGRKTTNAG